jgi:hypothetical protein
MAAYVDAECAALGTDVSGFLRLCIKEHFESKGGLGE